MRIEWRKKLALGPVLLWMAVYSGLCLAAAHDPLEAAQTAFNRGRADEALHNLEQTLRADSRNASAWNLQCRVYLAQARWEDAIESCQHAVQIAPENSGYHLWLGRAYGEKASRAKLVAAYQTAKLVHSEFEAAVALDGQNRQALSDLGQYYVEAPRILGGGYVKAQDLVARLNTLDAARAEELKARIAEAKKDYASADQNWRARIAMPHLSPEETAQAWMDLGSFYRRRGQWDQMLAALKNGAVADTSHGPALVDGASTLIAAGREPKLAAQWLRAYLEGNALSETAPAFAVHAELGDLLKKQGDIPGADREFAAARALSANYSEAATVSAGY